MEMINKVLFIVFTYITGSFIYYALCSKYRIVSVCLSVSLYSVCTATVIKLDLKFDMRKQTVPRMRKEGRGNTVSSLIM